MSRVLVGAPLVGDALERVRAVAELVTTDDPIGWSRAELLARVVDVDALIAMPSQRVDAELLDRAPGLRVVANHAVGVDNVDLQACAARSVVVTNTPGVLTEATADLAFGLLLDACRRISEGDRVVRAGGWRGWGPTVFLGARVTGATLGIIGFGRIGRAVARRARGFEMRVIYASPRPPTPSAPDDAEGAERVTLDELLARADVVSVHAPLRPETRGLLSRERIAAMRRGAVLVNTARGALVDEDALAEALVDGRLAAAGLDVYLDEPRVSPALLAAPNLVLAPHLGSADAPTRAAMASLACGAVVAVLGGGQPPNRVV
ncbi:MAG: D-glycerate dehydrogenase [Deltaproteobacteria bacterium]|nr:D-glycerate dehydrogenase [Deltaproteobacteria bacterium]